jgi:transcriptional regulator with XRE-family HTH domain
MEKFKVNNLALAKAIRVSHVTIGNYVGGQMPKSEHLLGLANYFICSADWLLGREGDDGQPLWMTPEHLKKVAALPADALREGGDPQAEIELWKRRAKKSEQELHELKTKLRELVK